MHYEYPTTVIQPSQPGATYESVSLHEENAASEMNSNKSLASPVDPQLNHSSPQLQHNPSYINKYLPVCN